TRSEQSADIVSRGAEHARGRIRECRAVIVGVALIVAAQNLDGRADLVRAVALAARVDVGCSVDAERQTAFTGDSPGQLPVAHNPGRKSVIEPRVSFAKRQLVDVVELEIVRTVKARDLLVQREGNRVSAPQAGIAVIAVGVVNGFREGVTQADDRGCDALSYGNLQ